MIRQYHASRSRGGRNPLRVGVIAVGSIYYIQDESFFRDRYGAAAVCRVPWIVEAFLNGTLAAAYRNSGTGQWEDRFMSGRSHQAVVRSLRDGRRKTVSVGMLIVHDDQGLSMPPATYPDLPDVDRFYRRRQLTTLKGSDMHQSTLSKLPLLVSTPQAAGQRPAARPCSALTTAPASDLVTT